MDNLPSALMRAPFTGALCLTRAGEREMRADMAREGWEGPVGDYIARWIARELAVHAES